MTEQRLNNCTIVHIHKDITDKIDLTLIAQNFAAAMQGGIQELKQGAEEILFCSLIFIKYRINSFLRVTVKSK